MQINHRIVSAAADIEQDRQQPRHRESLRLISDRAIRSAATAVVLRSLTNANAIWKVMPASAKIIFLKRF